MGDPAGCGPQITATAWNQKHKNSNAPFAVIADPLVFDDLCPIQTINRPAEAADVFSSALPVIPLPNSLPSRPVAGQPDTANAPGIIASIEIATQYCLDGQAAAMVTNPISKAVLYEAGFAHPGHTEFIAELCADAGGQSQPPVMMLVGGGLRVALATIHIPLINVAQTLTSDLLHQTASIVHAALQRDFGIDAPRIAFTGLNPHAGEDGTIGREEVETINPAAEMLRGQGIDVSNARPADTVFHEALQGDFDSVIAMTHDQGLIPVKTLDMWGGVNTTLGLPIIRASPDHGTAFDAAARKACRPDSLLAALDLAEAMATNRSMA